ncbi:T9SS type A sorting domain-containing protein [Ulvibacter sp. MAR_2010_11]|uniref:T9SS type A sorting domain-containing protein n=1 Tax=Ulvibacter sp. MAR_2010_11 TaxID=1250229 RepID=UPI000C2CDE53|nr:T9SS type A sorting domain-containing protein [Ulvibacter sp. MAR_2010_11]
MKNLGPIRKLVPTLKFSQKSSFIGMVICLGMFSSCLGQYMQTGVNENELRLFNLETENNTSINQIRLYPNPSTDLITIDLGAEFENADASIYSVLGEKLKQVNYKATSGFSMSISNLKSGAYFVIVTLPNGGARLKLVKE